MMEVFKKLANRYRSCVFLYVDVDEIDLVAEEYAVYAMPNFVFLKRKNIPLKGSRVKGLRTEEPVKNIEKLAYEHSS